MTSQLYLSEGDYPAERVKCVTEAFVIRQRTKDLNYYLYFSNKSFVLGLKEEFERIA
jgi:hypothetical protein